MKAIEEKNLCATAFHLLQKDFQLPNVHIHLQKKIPIAAGLGGASSDAVSCMLGIEKLFNLSLSHAQRFGYARRLGSDCPFFLQQKAMLASERGDVLKEINLPIKGHHLLVVYPNVGSHTTAAYDSLTPQDLSPHARVEEILLSTPLNLWRTQLRNDFEPMVFRKHPLLQKIKEQLYAAGAWYAAMSGAGSALYGLFNTPPSGGLFDEYVVWQEVL